MVGIGTPRNNQYGGAPLVEHRSVVGVPVLVASPGRGENVSEEESQSFAVEIGLCVVGSENVGLPLDGSPPPAGSGDDVRPTISAQVIITASDGSVRVWDLTGSAPQLMIGNMEVGLGDIAAVSN